MICLIWKNKRKVTKKYWRKLYKSPRIAEKSFGVIFCHNTNIKRSGRAVATRSMHYLTLHNIYIITMTQQMVLRF